MPDEKIQGRDFDPLVFPAGTGDKEVLMKKFKDAVPWVCGLMAAVFFVMAASTAASTTESGGADIRAPMLALIAGALMCLSFAPLQSEMQRVAERALAALVATFSGWFWLVGTTGDTWSTLKGLGFVAALAATIVILLLGAIIPTVTAIRNWRNSRHP